MPCEWRCLIGVAIGGATIDYICAVLCGRPHHDAAGIANADWLPMLPRPPAVLLMALRAGRTHMAVALLLSRPTLRMPPMCGSACCD